MQEGKIEFEIAGGPEKPINLHMDIYFYMYKEVHYAFFFLLAVNICLFRPNFLKIWFNIFKKLTCILILYGAICSPALRVCFRCVCICAPVVILQHRFQNHAMLLPPLTQCSESAVIECFLAHKSIFCPAFMFPFSHSSTFAAPLSFFLPTGSVPLVSCSCTMYVWIAA